jgi:hypothetical protein
MTTVVVYKLEDLCYFISDQIPESTDAKYDDLMNYIQKTEWLRFHPVQYIVEIRDTDNMESVVIEYMKKYGINNVRASFSPYDTVLIESEIRSTIEKKIEDFIVEKKVIQKPISRKTEKVDYCLYSC